MILRLCVVIPAFDNARTISEVVKDVITCTPFPILVIDDGSETPVTNVLYSWEVRQALESGRVQVIRLDSNRGKGGAIQFAIHELVNRGFTHMLTMDADGQHFGREIKKLVDLCRLHPWHLILGDRKLKSATLPENKFRRAFSNFWVSYQTGLQIQDSQSGFRLYPLLPLQNMRFFTTRYDFEIEVLIRLMWQGIHVREVEIELQYPEGKERVSHFNKLWDNLRISFLNTLLVIVSLFKTHRSPGEFSVALGLGVAVGCTPFFGLHTVIIAVLAFLFRLNVIVMWIGTHVSTPLLAPFVVLAEIWIGKHWLNVGLDTAGKKGEFYQWVAGSGVLGLGLGVGTTVIAFTVAWIMQRRKKRTNWNTKARGGRLGNGFLHLILRYLGLQAGYNILFLIVPYFYLFAPKGRSGISEYWKLIRPRETWRQRQVRIFKHFYRFGQVLMDRAVQRLHKTKQFETTQSGVENILKAVDERSGLILLTCHAGSWDLTAELLQPHELMKHVVAVEASSGDAPTLKAGSIVSIMGDRPLADRFELIPFFGKLAPFDMTAFRLAAASSKPLLYAYSFKGQPGRYHFVAEPAKHLIFREGLSFELQCYAWAKDYVNSLERHVTEYPDQWFNFYPFWSALPLSPHGELSSSEPNHLVEDLESTFRHPLAPQPHAKIKD